MLVALLRAGWAPIDDEATISWRSWDVLAGHAPLVGQFTQASNGTGHAVFSPGPLLYWALALPVHIAPGAGPLIGVAVLNVVSVILACLAAAAVGGRAAAVAVSGGTVLVAWSAGYQLDSTVWNPYAALLPFAATVVVGWAVAAGRVRWWPCLVGLASFCMQAHLMYVPASAALIVIAPLVGIAASRRTGRAIRWRWAAAGTMVAALCWAAPVWQQLTAARGNLSLLLDSTLGRDGAKLGLSAGLRNLSRAVVPVQPLWLRAPAKADFLESGGISPRWAIGALVCLAAVVVIGWWRKRHEVTAVALVALIADLSAVAVIGGIPGRSGLTIVYIQYILWPVGAMTWFALGYSLALALRGPASRLVSHGGALQSRPVIRGVACVVVLLPVLGAALAANWQITNAVTISGLDASGLRSLKTRAADGIALAIGKPRRLENKRLALRWPAVRGFGELDEGMLMMTYAYKLRTHGWTPALVDNWQQLLEPVYVARADDSVLEVTSGSAPAGARRVDDISYNGGPERIDATLWLRPGRLPITLRSLRNRET